MQKASSSPGDLIATREAEAIESVSPPDSSKLTGPRSASPGRDGSDAACRADPRSSEDYGPDGSEHDRRWDVEESGTRVGIAYATPVTVTTRPVTQEIVIPSHRQSRSSPSNDSRLRAEGTCRLTLYFNVS